MRRRSAEFGVRCVRYFGHVHIEGRDMNGMGRAFVFVSELLTLAAMIVTYHEIAFGYQDHLSGWGIQYRRRRISLYLIGRRFECWPPSLRPMTPTQKKSGKTDRRS